MFPAGQKGQVNRKEVTIVVPSANDTALTKGRFVNLHSTKGLAKPSDGGDADLLLLNDVAANTHSVVKCAVVVAGGIEDVEPVDTEAFVPGDIISTDAEGRAKKGTAGTDVQLGRSGHTRAASSGGLLGIMFAKKGNA